MRQLPQAIRELRILRPGIRIFNAVIEALEDLL
jgi:hypothetical protein